MRKSGHADLPLHGGQVPRWLKERMVRLSGAVIEAVAWHYGRREVLSRLSDPCWFQAFGCVLGMDWHSSGITTSTLSALKRAINPLSREIGIYVCGGRGNQSRKTPEELLRFSGNAGIDGEDLVRSSRLVAKVDNTAVQDGFQLYLHTFIVSREGEWTVVQQGMNPENRTARRYHWLSRGLRSFVEEPHSAVIGRNRGLILNLTHREARPTRDALVAMTAESPARMALESRRILMSRDHAVRAGDVNLKRLAAVLAAAHDTNVRDFASMLLCPGLGPRTLRSLTLVSEVIHGTPSRFLDPARFSMAHGGKDGHPFPVPLTVYDRSIGVLKKALDHAKIGHSEKLRAIRSLDRFARRIEKTAEPEMDFDAFLEKERAESHRYGGRTVFGPAKPPPPSKQLELFP